MNSDIVKLPSSPAAGASNLEMSGIMALGKGFARDGFGACSLGFEIFVRWTSYLQEADQTNLVGPVLSLTADIGGSWLKSSGQSASSGWTRLAKMVQIWPA